MVPSASGPNYLQELTVRSTHGAAGRVSLALEVVPNVPNSVRRNVRLRSASWSSSRTARSSARNQRRGRPESRPAASNHRRAVATPAGRAPGRARRVVVGHDNHRSNRPRQPCPTSGADRGVGSRGRPSRPHVHRRHLYPPKVAGLPRPPTYDRLHDRRRTAGLRARPVTTYTTRDFAMCESCGRRIHFLGHYRNGGERWEHVGRPPVGILPHYARPVPGTLITRPGR